MFQRNPEHLALVDAPIAVNGQAASEPLAVVGGQVVVALFSAFESGDGDYRDAEVVGDHGEGDVLGLAGRPKIGVVVDWIGPGEESEDLAGDGAFEQSQDLFLGAALGSLALDVAASPWLDMRTRAIRCSALLAARSPPRESRWRVVLPEDAGTGAAPHSAANAASLRSRCALVPAVTSNWAATSGPTP
jgi:hypothetical protein